MITTKGVYHVGIRVNDAERAVKFYTEILGMTIAKFYAPPKPQAAK